ncbi:MAG: transcription initiation factor IIB family protein [Promethearchaeota archaeon]
MIKFTLIEKIEYRGSQFCPECNGPLITIIEKGETVCCQCGLISDDKIFLDSLNEPKISSKEQINRSVSSQFPNMGLYLITKKKANDPNLKRALKLNSHLPWDKKNLLIALIELKRLNNKLSLPSYFVKEAFKLYKEALNKSLIKGRTIKGIITVCLYYICKIHNIPRALSEFLDETSINEKRFNRYYSSLIKVLNLKIPIQNPIARVSKFITDLGLEFAIEKLTYKILDEYLKSNSIDGTNPNGICGGAIYLASKFNGKRIGQKRISDIVGISDSTLRARYYELINGINLNILNEK